MRDCLEIFKYYLRGQLKNDHLIVTDHEYLFYDQDKVGKILFYDHGFVEEIILYHDQVIFYLYYQFSSYAYAKKNFDGMMRVFRKENPLKKVIICCSGGLTSAYFTQKMNTFLKYNHAPYIVEAAAYDEVKDMVNDHELVLVAPQMRYALTQIQESVPQAHVEPIAPQVFASYDCAQLFKQILDFVKGEEDDSSSI
jgi:cellobiose-specific phosphotransferase system component IIB